jgi:protein OS-9
MVIDTPRLCSDVAFLPPQETKPHAIACTPVLPATSIPSYLAAKESSDAAADAEDDRLTQELIDAVNLLETGQIPVRNIHTEVVGNIEVGARKFIPEDKKLEKGVIVGGGKEKFIATIASNDGFIVTDDDLARMKIKATRKHVEEFKEEVEREAKGRGWKLDVVEVGGHYELRGVIEQSNERADSQQQTEKPKDDSAKTEGSERENEKEEEGSEETYKEEL